MFWFALAFAAMQGAQQKGQAEAANITAKSNAKAANMVREANNELAAARGSLQRYQTSRRNSQFLKDMGAQYSADTTNLLRLQESALNGALDRRIRVAEEGGALAASLSAAGVGGGTAQMIDATQRLRSARIEQMATSQYEQQKSDLQETRSRRFDQMLLGLESPDIADNLNVAAVIPNKVAVPKWSTVLINAGLKAFAETADTMGGAKDKGPTLKFDRNAPLGGYAPIESVPSGLA